MRLITKLVIRKADVCVKMIRLSFAKKKDFSFFWVFVISKRMSRLRKKIPIKNNIPRLKRRKLVKARVNNAKLARNIVFRFRKVKYLYVV